MKTKLLAFIAGIIWLAAGFNVCRIGIKESHKTFVLYCSRFALPLQKLYKSKRYDKF